MTTCTDCNTASDEGTRLLLTRTGTGTYKTLCRSHRTELTRRMQGQRPSTSKSYTNYKE